VKQLFLRWKQDNWPDFLTGFGLLLVALGPFVRAIATPNSLAYGISELTGDMDYYYALEMFVRQAYSQGEWPLWNPYFGAGQPGLAAPLAATTYLVRHLTSWLPLPDALNWGAILHVWMAGLGMFVLLRDMGARHAAAAFSAIGFMFSGAISPRFLAGHHTFVYAMAWPAWILVFYRRLLETGSWRHLTLTIATTTLALQTGHLQFVGIALLIPITYFITFAVQQIIARAWQRLGHRFIISLILTIFVAGLAAIHLLPTMEMFPLTRRAAEGIPLQQVFKVSLDYWELGTIFVPFLWFDLPTRTQITMLGFWEMFPYAGLVTVGLAALAPFSSNKGQRIKTLYLSALGGVGLLLSWNNSPIYRLIYSLVPIVRYSGRFVILWVFAITVLGGFGLENLLAAVSGSKEQRTEKKLLIVKIALVSLVVLTITGTLVWQIWGEHLTEIMQTSGHFFYVEPTLFIRMQQRNLHALLAVLIAALVWISSRKLLPTHWWAWLAVAILLIEMYLFAWPLTAPDDVTELYDPESPLELLEIDPAEVRVHNDSYAPSHNVPYSGYPLNDMLDLAVLQPISDLGMDNGRGSQLLAAGYFVTDEPVSEPSVEEIQHVGSAYLYGYVDRWPRIYAAPAVQIVSSDDEALAMVAEEEFDPFAVAVVIATDDVPELPPQSPGAPAQVNAEFIEYGLNSFRARVDTDRPVMVVFSETYYPGWEARVDGEPAQIWQANYGFRGIVVDEGVHIIEMDYRPMSFRVGLSISLGTLALMVLTSGVLIVRRYLLHTGKVSAAS
jgi:hypothetical protein